MCTHNKDNEWYKCTCTYVTRTLCQKACPNLVEWPICFPFKKGNYQCFNEITILWNLAKTWVIYPESIYNVSGTNHLASLNSHQLIIWRKTIKLLKEIPCTSQKTRVYFVRSVHDKNHVAFIACIQYNTLFNFTVPHINDQSRLSTGHRISVPV